MKNCPCPREQPARSRGGLLLLQWHLESRAVPLQTVLRWWKDQTLLTAYLWNGWATFQTTSPFGSNPSDGAKPLDLASEAKKGQRQRKATEACWLASACARICFSVWVCG